MTRARHGRMLLLLAGLWPLMAALAQDTTLVARVDRESVHANESFTYILRAEGSFSGRPDLSALTRDFDVVGTGSSSNIQIQNGEMTQIAQWNVELMPRASGDFNLPAIELDGLLSNSVEVKILPPETVAGAAEDVFMEVELDRSEAFVLSQAIYTLRLFVDVNTDTGREELIMPGVAGGEAIVEKLGDDDEYKKRLGGREYRVRERKFAIFPQAAGVLTIGPAEYRATVMPSFGFTRQQRTRSDVVELTVLPAVPPPSAFPDAAWLPARDLRIEETWADTATEFEQGVPRTRQLTIVADGLLETQLPELNLTATEGLRQYSDQPELSRDVSEAGIEARRTERYAVIANRPGTIEFPAVELPWWNVEAERWEVARIDPAIVTVEPGQAPERPAPIPTPSAASAPVEGDPGFWPWLSAALAAGWIGTIALWALLRRGGRKPKPTQTKARPTSVRTLLKQLSAACRVDDAERTRDLLLEWASRQFTDDPPTSLGALAGRLSGPLAREVMALESALYGAESNAWSGKELAELIRTTQSVRPSAAEDGQDPLLPLYR